MKIEGYDMPEDLYCEEHHYWLRKEGDVLVMGMDDFAQKLAGEVVFVQLPFEGKKLKKGKKFSQVESGKWLDKIYAPVNGEIAQSNAELELNPTLINADCYGSGWMFKIIPDDLSEINELIHDPAEIEKWILADIEKFS